MLDKKHLIVSLTSISSRLDSLEGVVNSILMQDCAPDQIILVLSEAPMNIDAGVKWCDVPDGLRNLDRAGKIEILFSENIGPYRKLIPVLEKVAPKGSLVVTADDDVLYPSSWLGSISGSFEGFATVSYRSRAMQVINGKISGYRQWRLMEDPKRSFGQVLPIYEPIFTLPTGKAGVLYDVDYFRDIDLLNCMRELAPMQDDLGFKFYGILNEHKTHHLGVRSGLTDLRLDSPSLYDENRANNDLAIEKLCSFIEGRGFDISKYLS